MTTHLSEQHHDDLEALRRILPQAAGTLRALTDDDRSDRDDILRIADALFATCEVLGDMGVHRTTVPVDAAVAYLTYRGRLVAAIRRCYLRADRQVPA